MALPAHLQQGTELLDLAHVNATVIGNDTEPTLGPSLFDDPIDLRFKTKVYVYPDIKISGKSAYMNILLAMIQLSYCQSTDEYAGGTFSFPDYTNIKIHILKAASLSSAFQYRYAI